MEALNTYITTNILDQEPGIISLMNQIKSQINKIAKELQLLLVALFKMAKVAVRILREHGVEIAKMVFSD
jgi:seryl-tRNA(Sec) selenium transferase